MSQLIHRQAGITIVETLIVLSISAIVLAAVIIMVPILQRNQRNDARKRDISYAHSRLTALAPLIARNWSAIGAVKDNLFNDDQSAYYSQYGWSDAANWDAVKAKVDQGGVARSPILAWTSKHAATTTANRFDIWYNRERSTHIDKHPGPGSDELPGEDDLDIFFGWRCHVPTLSRPNAGVAYYPNDANGTWSASGQIINQFVAEASNVFNFAIVYKLEGVDVWNCHDDSN